MLLLAGTVVHGWSWTRADPASLMPADLAMLRSEQSRADFSCQVRASKPFLGFDLRFHWDYRATFPLKVLATSGDSLEVLLQVTPAANTHRGVFISQRFAAPVFPPGMPGLGESVGGFDLGPGRYRVDWLLRDGRGRACSFHWKVDAKVHASQRHPALAMASNAIADWSDGMPGGDPQAARPAGKPLNVKILLNFSPAKPWESILNPDDAMVLISMLRSVTRAPGVGRFSLLAFNLRTQKILYQAQSASTLDVPALVQTLLTRTTGTIEYRLLKDPRSETNFAAELLASQLGEQQNATDAIIILGPKVTLNKKIPLELLKAGGTAKCPIFYFNYNPDPVDQPWRDTIGSALKAYRRARAYNIVGPADFGLAMRDLIATNISANSIPE